MGILLETGPSPRGWSRLQTAQQCMQKYAYKYEDPLLERSSESPALIRGSLIHLGLAHHYSRMKAEQNGEDPKKILEPKSAIELSGMQKGGMWEAQVDHCIKCI